MTGWTTMFGLLGNAVVEIEAYKVEGGYIVRRNSCMREFVEEGKLSTTRREAERRFLELEQNKPTTSEAKGGQS